MGRPTTIDISTVQQRARIFLLIALAALVGVGMPLASSAQTLRGSSFTTSTNGHTVEWNENWNASLEGDDEFATMVMLEGQIMIYAVMFIHDPLAGLNAKTVYYSLSGVLTQSFDSTPTQSVEWAGETGSFHGAHTITLSGIDFVLYLRVDPAASSDTGPIMQLAAAPVRAFPVSLESMQAEIMIDGQPSLNGDDGEEIMERLSFTNSSASPDADAAAVPQGRLPADAHGLAPENPLTYESADNEFTVTYSSTWVNMAESSATVGEFSLTDSASERVVVSFSGRDTSETNREAFFAEIVQRERRYPGFIGSVVSADRLLIAAWSTDSELSLLEYVFVDDDTLVTVMVTVRSTNPDRYIEGIAAIELQGEGILRDWDQLPPRD